MVAAHGGRSLYVKDRRLKYVYNFVDIREQMIDSTKDVPTGKVILSAAFEREGDGMPTTGTLSLYVKDPAEPVTDDYPGVRPYAFTGGTISQAIVDVPGEQFIDLEKEAIAMMARE